MSFCRLGTLTQSHLITRRIRSTYVAYGLCLPLSLYTPMPLLTNMRKANEQMGLVDC